MAKSTFEKTDFIGISRFSLKIVRIACPPVDRLPDIALDAKEMFSYARNKLYLWLLIA